MALGDKSVYSPISAIKNLFRKPKTVRYPKEELDVFPVKGVSPNYRGMHTNDTSKCIGCASCARICPVNAIVMTLPEGKEDVKKEYRPVIDYGRCCFCAFCVDMCPTDSLRMSRDYIYRVPTPMEMRDGKEVEHIQDKFVIMPDETHGDNIGYATGKKKKVLG